MLFNRSPQTSQASSACRGWIFPSRQHQSHLCTNIGFFEIGARKRLQDAPPILTSLLEGEIRLADPRGDRLQGLSHRADYRNHVRSGCWGSVFCFKQGILWDRLRFSSRLRWVFGHRFWAGWWVYFVESPYTQTFATTGHPFNTDSTLPRETYLVIVSIYSCQYNRVNMMTMMMLTHSPNWSLTRSFFLSTILTTPNLSISPMSPVLNHLWRKTKVRSCNFWSGWWWVHSLVVVDNDYAGKESIETDLLPDRSVKNSSAVFSGCL